MKTLEDLFLKGLRDMYYAEERRDMYCTDEQLVKALPKRAKVATHEDLRETIQVHLIETEVQVHEG